MTVAKWLSGVRNLKFRRPSQKLRLPGGYPVSLLLGVVCVCFLQAPVQPNRQNETVVPEPVRLKPAQEGEAESVNDETSELSEQDDVKRSVAREFTGPLGLPYGIRGRVNLKYVGRWTEGAHDNDLYVHSSVDFGDSSRHLLSGHVSGRAALDMDRNRRPNHPFRSIDDTYSKDVTGRLYSAYVDLNDVDGNPVRDVFERVRVGRQILYDTPETLFFDGVSLRSPSLEEALDLRLMAFVGVPNHIFESSSSQDLTVGAAAEVMPWRGGQFRFDYMHVTDAYLGQTALDDLYGLSGSQRFGDLFLAAHMNFVESDARDFGVQAVFNLPDSGFSVTARYDGLLSDQKRNSIDFDFFTPVQATYFSYHQYSLFAHKGFGDQVFVDGGVQRRVLQQDRNEGLFNHEFTRYYLTPGISAWPLEGSTLSLSAEFWDSGGDRFTAFGGDLTHEFDEQLSATLGTMFQLFRYDVLVDQERQDVQVSYARVDFHVSESCRVRAAFEYEDGDMDDFAKLTIGLRFDF